MNIHGQADNRNTKRWQNIFRLTVFCGTAVLVIVPLDINGWLVELLRSVV